MCVSHTHTHTHAHTFSLCACLFARQYIDKGRQELEQRKADALTDLLSNMSRLRNLAPPPNSVLAVPPDV